MPPLDALHPENNRETSARSPGEIPDVATGGESPSVGFLNFSSPSGFGVGAALPLSPPKSGGVCFLEGDVKNIFRIERRDNPFVQIDRGIFENPNLSWKAKGLLGYLLSRPDDWVVRAGDLVNRSTDGNGAVASGLKELKKAGHARLERLRDDKGQVLGTRWVISEVANAVCEESPQETQTEMPVSRVSGNPHTENPGTENPDTVFPVLTNKDSTKNECTNMGDGGAVVGFALPVETNHQGSKTKEEEAAEIYEAYPRKEARQDALKAILKAMAKKSAGELLEATMAYAEAVSQWPMSDRRFIPHPASWFNAGRYDDDRRNWVRRNAPGARMSFAG